MFYENFVRMAVKLGMSPSAAAESMGFKRSVVTRWKGGSEPRQATVQRIADFFGCTPQELLSGDVTEEDMGELRQAFRDRPEIRALCGAAEGVPASKVYDAVSMLLRWKEENNA